MFSSFDSLNTPGVKIWDYSKTSATTPGASRLSLEDDCAPVQVFLTGGTTNAIIVSLPLNSNPGKTITIKNDRYGASQQVMAIYDSANPITTTNPYQLGQGGSFTFVLIPQISGLSSASNLGPAQWILIQGGTSTYASNAYGASLSGYANHAIGSFSSIAGGSGNSVSTSYSAIGGGSGNNISNSTMAIIAGGESNSTSGQHAVIGGGLSNSVSGSKATVAGGWANTANATASTVPGGYNGTTRTIQGAYAFPACNIPIANSPGISQGGLLILGKQTIDATPSVILSTTSGAGTTNQLILPNNSAYYVKGSVIANVTGAGNTKAWTFECAIKRGANAASTTIVGAVSTNIIAQDAGASSWTIAVTADTTNGGLAVTVTGQAATTIRWVCKLESTEVTF